MTDLQNYLQRSGTVLQLATVHDGKPWVATVYFMVDDDLQVYWLSWPERRHSREIAENTQVAATVVIKTNRPAIGVQLEGAATVVTDASEVQRVMERYVAKYDEGQQFYDAFVAGTNKHVMYKLAPSAIWLFDEVNHAGESPLQVL